MCTPLFLGDLVMTVELLCWSFWKCAISSLTILFRFVTVACGMGESIGATLHQSAAGHAAGTRFPRKLRSGRTGSGLHMTCPRCEFEFEPLEDVRL